MRNHHALYGHGRGEAEFSDGLHDAVVDAESVEAVVGRRIPGLGHHHGGVAAAIHVGLHIGHGGSLAGENSAGVDMLSVSVAACFRSCFRRRRPAYGIIVCLLSNLFICHKKF